MSLTFKECDMLLSGLRDSIENKNCQKERDTCP